MKIRIYLIEDYEPDADAILQELMNKAKNKNTDDLQFEFISLPGTNRKKVREKEYLFYDDTIMQTLEEKYNEENNGNVKIGVLLDVMLVQEDVESSYAHYYPEASIAKKIYFDFSDKMPIYFISAYPEFATQCEVIMGEDLSDKFITKNAVLRYHIQADIDKMFNFYKKGCGLEE